MHAFFRSGLPSITLALILVAGCVSARRGGGTDAGRPDAGGVDAGDLDGGGLDGGPIDGGGTDFGAIDAGTDSGVVFDAGTDAGVRDAGRDAGPIDAGRRDGLAGMRVLLFDDTSGMTQADEAVMARGGTVTVVTDGPTFATDLDAGGYSIVIVESAVNTLPAEVATRVPTWIAAGGTLIFSYWSLDTNPTLQAGLGVSCSSFTTVRTVYRDATTTDFFGAPSPFTSPQTGADTLGDDGDVLTIPSGGFVAARFDSTSGANAMVVNGTHRVILLGFMPYEFTTNDGDGDGVPDMRELYENELSYLGL